MPCLVVLLALVTPRLLIFLIWFFTTWFRGMVPNIVVLILGFIFLPMTLLWYTAVQHWFAGQWTFWPVVGMVLALLMDVSPARSGRRWRT
jgi:hypothetical protein